MILIFVGNAESNEGICEIFAPRKVSQAETITVYIDMTTTSHYYTVATATTTLTTKHKAIQATPCVTEIGRLPPRSYKFWDRDWGKYMNMVKRYCQRYDIVLDQKQEEDLNNSITETIYKSGDDVDDAQIVEILTEITGKDIRLEKEL